MRDAPYAGPRVRRLPRLLVRVSPNGHNPAPQIRISQRGGNDRLDRRAAVSTATAVRVGGWLPGSAGRIPACLERKRTFQDNVIGHTDFVRAVLERARGQAGFRATSAGWQSGYAAACKAVYAGSIPAPASKSVRTRESEPRPTSARVAKLVDARDLKSLGVFTVPVRVRPRAPDGPSATALSLFELLDRSPRVPRISRL